MGCHGVPHKGLVPYPPKANSTICVLPSTIIPAASSRSITVAVVVPTRVDHAWGPTAPSLPSISQRSFTAMGKPCSGPTGHPDRWIRSAASAAASA